MSMSYHIPVLAAEVVRELRPRAGATFVDCTAGGGSHSRLLAEHLGPGGKIVLIDRDPEALEACRAALAQAPAQVCTVQGNFADLRALLDALDIAAVDGILLDLGVSSHQLDTPSRGFSFRADAPLDMRMDPTSGETAAEYIERADVEELERILREYADERYAGRIARAIVRCRASAAIRTTGELANIVSNVLPRNREAQQIHPATRTFQAIRIQINNEIGALESVLHQGIDSLRSGGRMAVIAYHSAETRVVKRSFAWHAGKCQCPPGLPVCQCGATPIVRIITRKAIAPTEAEIAQNPRSRSAKLRVVERL